MIILKLKSRQDRLEWLIFLNRMIFENFAPPNKSRIDFFYFDLAKSGYS